MSAGCYAQTVKDEGRRERWTATVPTDQPPPPRVEQARFFTNLPSPYVSLHISSPLRANKKQRITYCIHPRSTPEPWNPFQARCVRTPTPLIKIEKNAAGQALSMTGGKRFAVYAIATAGVSRLTSHSTTSSTRYRCWCSSLSWPSCCCSRAQWRRPPQLQLSSTAVRSGSRCGGRPPRRRSSHRISTTSAWRLAGRVHRGHDARLSSAPSSRKGQHGCRGRRPSSFPSWHLKGIGTVSNINSRMFSHHHSIEKLTVRGCSAAPRNNA